MTGSDETRIDIGGIAYGPDEIETLRAELIPLRNACLGPDYFNSQGAVLLSHVIGVLHELPKHVWPLRQLQPEDIEELARIIAHMHGAQMAMRRNGETLTVAAMAGYGSFGDSPGKFAVARWHEYVNAAKAAIDFLAQKPEPIEGENEPANPTSTLD